MVLKSAGGHRIIPIGHLVLLPRNGDWSIAFQRDMRAIVLSVTSDALHGRHSGKPRLGEPRVVPPGGFADVFARLLDATARTLDTLSDAEWNSLAQSLVDLQLTLTHQLAASSADAGSSATQAALLHRICQTIERRLDDPDLVPARVAQAEGISERYLQKLFETVGDNFIASVGSSVPGPICRARLKRIVRSRRSPMPTASAIPRISVAPSVTASACRRANFASRRRSGRHSSTALPDSVAGRRRHWHSFAHIRARRRAAQPPAPAPTSKRRRSAGIIISRSTRAASIGAISAARCRHRSRSPRATPSPSKP